MRAYAKINLALSVGPPFPAGCADAGMHPIASWMHAIDLFDDVEVEAQPAGSIDHYDIRWTPSAPRRSIVDWPLDQDYAVRAHRLLEAHTRKRLPVNLSVVKRIPVGAGLGGGSSDAAAALLLINSVFNLGLSTAELTTLSRTLGSDVAFFLDDPPPRPAIVTGAGSIIERIERVAGHILLILPNFPCPTGEIYKAFDRVNHHQLREPDVRSLARAGWVESRTLFNDLDQAAEAFEPRLSALRASIRKAAGQPVHMTGSGSALFIPCTEEPEARRLHQTILPHTGGAAIARVRLL